MAFIVTCPHCSDEILIEEVNCKIFRHATYKNGEEFHPHASEEACMEAILNDSVYGCVGPFRISIIDNKWVAQACEYI